jgi:excisionase family DNA binding protein
METYLTIADLAAAVQLSEQTIRRYVLHKEIPYHKIKKVIRFRPSEIETWIESGGIDTTVEMDKTGDLFTDLETTDSGGADSAGATEKE